MSSAKKAPTPVDNSDDDMYVPSSEAEVERNLYSCHIVDDVDDQTAPPPVVEGAAADGDDDEALSYASDNATLSTNSKPAKGSSTMTDVNLNSGTSDKAMVVDDVEDIDIMKLDQNVDRLSTSNLEVVPSPKFYGSNRTKGRQNAISKTNPSAMDVDEDEDVVVVVLDPAPKCVSPFSTSLRLQTNTLERTFSLWILSEHDIHALFPSWPRT